MAPPSAPVPVRPALDAYVDENTFPPQLRAFMEVSRIVKSDGLLGRARWYYVVVAIVILLALGGCVTGFILLGSSWLQLLIAGVLGVVFTQIAFMGHEAGHRQILVGGRANTRLARILAGIVGLSYDWWETKHSRHHANPNRVGKDPDIAVDTISFIPVDAAAARGPRRWLTRKQGWLFFPLLTLEGLNLYMHSVKHVVFERSASHRWSELTLLLARFTAVLVPVFLLLPLGMACAFVGVQVAVFGVYMGSSFAPNHKGMPVVNPDARMDFFSKQVRMSRNVKGGWWATALLGGLNYQIEHHLFPNMPRPHLARARVIVKDHCARLSVPYTEETLLRSYGIVIRYLNDVGLAARDPFECPILQQYRNQH